MAVAYFFTYHGITFLIKSRTIDFINPKIIIQLICMRDFVWVTNFITDLVIFTLIKTPFYFNGCSDKREKFK